MTVYAVNPEDLQAMLVATLGEQVLHIAISRDELCLDVRAADQVRCKLRYSAVGLLLVPSARLELAQLSPLPPQDSVSTNFTTTA